MQQKTNPNEKGQTTMDQKIIKAKQRFIYMANDFKLKDGYHIDDENKPVLNALIHYFMKDERFASDRTVFLDADKYEPSLDKGIILMGNVGSGKTILMDIFKNVFGGFGIVTCRQIAAKYTDEGHQSLAIYGRDAVQENTKWKYSHGIAQRTENGTIHYNKLFDDLGAEGDAAYYANKINVIGEVIQDRYETFCKYPNLVTHFTTNLTIEEIESNYGTRVVSRLHQMCNFIKLGGTSRSTDRRKK